MAKFEAFGWSFSSSTNLLFLKSGQRGHTFLGSARRDITFKIYVGIVGYLSRSTMYGSNFGNQILLYFFYNFIWLMSIFFYLQATPLSLQDFPMWTHLVQIRICRPALSILFAWFVTRNLRNLKSVWCI